MTLSYTVLYVQNVRASVDFYQAAFGLELRFVHESGDYAEMNTGETTLAFCAHALAEQIVHKPYTKAELARPVAGQIGFAVEDVRRAFERAVASGASVCAEPEIKPWNFESAMVQDIDGHLVEFARNLAQ